MRRGWSSGRSRWSWGWSCGSSIEVVARIRSASRRLGVGEARQREPGVDVQPVTGGDRPVERQQRDGRRRPVPPTASHGLAVDASITWASSPRHIGALLPRPPAPRQRRRRPRPRGRRAVRRGRSSPASIPITTRRAGQPAQRAPELDDLGESDGVGAAVTGPGPRPGRQGRPAVPGSSRCSVPGGSAGHGRRRRPPRGRGRPTGRAARSGPRSVRTSTAPPTGSAAATERATAGPPRRPPGRGCPVRPPAAPAAS